MLSSSNAPSRKERNVASDDDEDPFITFAIETPLLFLPLLFLSSTASKISASTDTSSSFLRRAFNANEDKDDDFEDEDDDFCRTMENFFCCDFDFSKRFEEEEKEDEEHAIIETEVAVEAMMTTKKTMGGVLLRSVLSVLF